MVLSRNWWSLVLCLLPCTAVPSLCQSPRLNKVIELFEKKTPAFGSFVTTVSIRSAAEHSSLPLDFVIVDMEHTPYDPSLLQQYLLGMVNRRRILEKGNLQPDVMPFVRLPGNGREHTQFLIKQALDLGVYGVLMPHVNSREQALWAVRSSRYGQMQGAPDFEPLGERGGGPRLAGALLGAQWVGIRPAGRPLAAGPAGRTAAVGDGRVEGSCRARGRDRSVPGVGGLFAGPGDLAFSLGVPLGDPAVEVAVQKILAACRASGVPCGTVAETPEINKRLAEGFRFLVVYNNPVPAEVGAARAKR